MAKYTEQDKTDALCLLREGFTAREIYEYTGIPIGTLNRWRFEASTQQAGASGSELLQLRQKLEALQQELSELREQIAPMQKEWERARLRRLEEQEQENPSGFKFRRP